MPRPCSAWHPGNGGISGDLFKLLGVRLGQGNDRRALSTQPHFLERKSYYSTRRFLIFLHYLDSFSKTTFQTGVFFTCFLGISADSMIGFGGPTNRGSTGSSAFFVGADADCKAVSRKIHACVGVAIWACWSGSHVILQCSGIFC